MQRLQPLGNILFIITNKVQAYFQLRHFEQIVCQVLCGVQKFRDLLTNSEVFILFEKAQIKTISYVCACSLCCIWCTPILVDRKILCFEISIQEEINKKIKRIKSFWWILWIKRTVVKLTICTLKLYVTHSCSSVNKTQCTLTMSIVF